MSERDDCCAVDGATSVENLHLAILGGGSAAMSAALKASELGARVTMVNAGLPFGGTCVNVGCVPSKALIRAAEAHYRAVHHPFEGIRGESRLEDFGAVIRQKRALVKELRQGKYEDVFYDLPNAQLAEGRGRILAPNLLEVEGEKIEADRILIATGARPFIPPVPGLEEAGVLTNESAFELEELPGSLIVLGGRYIALEIAQMFSRFGSRVTLLQRSGRILPAETADLTDLLAGYLGEEGIEIVTGVQLQRAEREGEEIVVHAVVGGVERSFRASHVLAATGRVANTDGIGLEEVGVATNEKGFVRVDPSLRTTIPGIYAAGDVIGPPMYVYTGALEGALAAENALGGEQNSIDYGPLPWVIFTDPQVAGVGLDEEQAKSEGLEVETATLLLSHVPRALAARDTRGMIKLIRESGSDRLVGARILAHEGSELLMELSLAISRRVTVHELAKELHPYLTLSEGVKLAAISFDRDPGTLSCCAV